MLLFMCIIRTGGIGCYRVIASHGGYRERLVRRGQIMPAEAIPALNSTTVPLDYAFATFEGTS